MGTGSGLTRAQLLQRGAGAVLLGGAASGAAYDVLTGAAEALAGVSADPAAVQQFVSRPDLTPAAVTVLRRPVGVASGRLFLAPSSGPGQRGSMIADGNGELVWWRPSTPKTTMDFRAGFYKGKPVLSFWEGQHVKGVGKVGEYVMLDSSYREVARFSAGRGVRPDFHEFLLTPSGTALVTAYDPVSANLASVGGPKRGRVYDGVVRELEIPSARVLFEWRSHQHVSVGESYQTQIGDPYDYFHVNSVGFDVDGNLLVSARNTWTIYKVNVKTGRVIWRLGGKKSDFAMGKGTTFAFQHDARSHANGRLISLFDNGPHPKTKPTSRAIVLRLDLAHKRATLARQLTHAPALFARVTGNAQLLPNGNYLVCWGSTGYFTEFAPDGTVRFDGKLPKGGQNYRVLRFPWIGRPTEPPRLAAKTVAGRRLLYASWNGATEVSSWQLATGSAPGNLQPAATMPKQGFETELPVPAGVAYASVIGLDRNGKPLGTSAAIQL